MRLPNIEPFSGEPSTRLKFLAGYFVLSGVLAIIVAFVTAGRIITGDSGGESTGASLFRSILLAATGTTWIVTGRLLRRQRRSGAIRRSYPSCCLR